LGVSPVKNLMDYRVSVRRRGVNLHSLGDSATFDEDTAMEVFEDVISRAREYDEKNYPTVN
jgi:hypothetical protein